MTAGACPKITDLDAIVPLQQSEICCELGRLKVKEGNAPCAARATQCDSTFVIEIMESGHGVAEQIILEVAGKNLDGIQLQFGMFERRAMLKEQNVGCRESLNRLGFPDQDAMTQAKGDGLESFEWERYAWTGRVVRTEDSTGCRDVTDQEPEPGNSQGWRNGLFGERLAAQGWRSRAVRRSGRLQNEPGKCGYPRF